MKRFAVVLSALGVTLALSAAPVWAAPSSQAPVQLTPGGDDHAHAHKVLTPSGCVSIDRVFFEVADRGLHHGAAMSGPDAGPWHVGPFPGMEPCP